MRVRSTCVFLVEPFLEWSSKGLAQEASPDLSRYNYGGRCDIGWRCSRWSTLASAMESGGCLVGCSID